MQVDLKELISEAVEAKGISGIMELTELCQIDYRKVKPVWDGSKQSKFFIVEEILNSLGYKLKAVPQND
jgi:hypothetical protein